MDHRIHRLILGIFQMLFKRSLLPTVRSLQGEFELVSTNVIGGELIEGNDAGFREGCPQRDRIMTGRENEAVALWPLRVLRVVAQLMEIDRRERVRDAEALREVALADRARHAQQVPAHRLGALPQERDRPVGAGRIAAWHQSLSNPPDTFSRSAVM